MNATKPKIALFELGLAKGFWIAMYRRSIEIATSNQDDDIFIIHITILFEPNDDMCRSVDRYFVPFLCGANLHSVVLGTIQ